MAFNPSPEVRAAADFAKEFGCDRVIIYYTKTNSDEFGYASYGENTAKCGQARRIADKVFDAVGKAIAEVVL